jgi:hypothetical protein
MVRMNTADIIVGEPVNQLVHLTRSFKESFHFSGKIEWATLHSFGHGIHLTRTEPNSEGARKGTGATFFCIYLR